MTYDSIHFQKDSVAILENFRKIKIVNPKPIKSDTFVLELSNPDEINLEFLYSFEDKNRQKIGFDKKDSLYLLSQNEIKDTITLPQNILEKANVLSEKQRKNWYQYYNSFYEFNFTIISKDKTKAYIEIGYICGGLCGSGRAYILQKKEWKMDSNFQRTDLD